MKKLIHECQCVSCREDRQSNEREIHHQLNVLLSRLDEEQRRWYVVLESKKIGHGGDKMLSEIT